MLLRKDGMFLRKDGYLVKDGMFLRKDDVFLKINSRFQQPFNGKKIKLKYLYLVLLNLIRKQIIICFLSCFYKNIIIYKTQWMLHDFSQLRIKEN